MPRSTDVRSALPEKIVDDLTRMVWMGLDGRQQDLERYIRRVLPKWESEVPGLVERLAKLLEPRQGSMARHVVPNPPYSAVSQPGGEFSDAIVGSPAADFLRIETVTELPLEPVWSSSILSALEDILRERQMIAELEKAGLKPSRTVVFTGPPGVGKTLAARWLARELKLPLAILNLGAVMSSFLGRTGANIRQVMDFARSRPCILLLDELDAIAKRRDDQSDIGELKRLVTVLLQELDLWPSSGLLVATTNHEQLIDPAVWRRFERRIVFPLPGPDEQLALLRCYLDGHWTDIPAKKARAIGLIGSHLSQAELTLIAQRSLREQVLGMRPINESLEIHLAVAASSLPLAERKGLGQSLTRLGLGQREVHRLTGLARETLRKDETKKSK